MMGFPPLNFLKRRACHPKWLSISVKFYTFRVSHMQIPRFSSIAEQPTSHYRKKNDVHNCSLFILTNELYRHQLPEGLKSKWCPYLVFKAEIAMSQPNRDSTIHLRLSISVLHDRFFRLNWGSMLTSKGWPHSIRGARIILWRLCSKPLTLSELRLPNE